MNEIYEISRQAKMLGGRVFYVGGCVRDRILGMTNKDIDIEVHGVTPSELKGILTGIGEPVEFGKSFGVFSLRGIDIDIAMPRRERNVGAGHRDFEIEVDPFIGTYEAARRRDFTINALMEDVLTGEIIDHFGGLDDLENGIIRHIDDRTFVEDPLRVLRAAQFAARFGFSVADETVELCRDIDISSLSQERVAEELKKALLRSARPSVFFETLRLMDQLDVWFPEVGSLTGVEQDVRYHPEGDVWNHTMEVLDRAAQYRAHVSDAFSFMLLALTHDFGKIVTTENVNGRIHSIDHEKIGLPLVKSFVNHIVRNKRIVRYLSNMVPIHMEANRLFESNSAVKLTNRMFDKAIAPEDLIWFAVSDHPADEAEKIAFLSERLSIYRKYMSRPYITGYDLIQAGFVPGKDFRKLMELSHKLRLAGIRKDIALKQVIGSARANAK